MDDGRNTFPSDCATNCCTSKPPLGFASRKVYSSSCPETPLRHVLKIGVATSIISQEDADAKALTQAIRLVNAALACQVQPTIYYNVEKSHTAACPEGYTGEASTVTVAAATYHSFISQQAADDYAQAQAEAGAIASLNCTLIPTVYHSSEQSATVECPNGTIGDPVTVTVEAGAFTSEVSQEDANAQAMASAQAQAESALVCTPITLCPAGLGPYTVNVTVTWDEDHGGTTENLAIQVSILPDFDDCIYRSNPDDIEHSAALFFMDGAWRASVNDASASLVADGGTNSTDPRGGYTDDPPPLGAGWTGSGWSVS